MKQRTTARMPKRAITQTPKSPASALTSKAAEKQWHLDEASGVAAPVIRANMISLRVSYQGRIQVAFFDSDPLER
jgi:hypothetical protein